MDGDGLHAGVPAISFKFPREPLDGPPTPASRSDADARRSEDKGGAVLEPA